MRLSNLEEHIKLRKQLSFNTALFYSLPIAIFLFILTISSGFFGALLFGALFGIAIFGFIYLIREITHKSVDRKRAKTNLSNDYIEVIFKGEIGLLEFAGSTLKYHTLTPGSSEKNIEIECDEKLFMATGLIKHSKMQSYRYKSIEEGHLTVKTMPHGLIRQFTFFNINDALNKVTDIVNKINKFEDN